MSSGSVCVPSFCTHKQMRLHILCDKRRSILGVTFRKASPTTLRISSLVVYRHGTTLPLILPRKELLGVVRSKLLGGHVNGARDFDEPTPVQRPGKHSKRRHRKIEVCLWPIVLQPHDIHVSPLSEPSLQLCRIRRRFHIFIENVRSDQIILPHTRSYHHSRRIVFQLLLEMGSLLWPEHHISAMLTAIVGRFITEKNHWSAYGTWGMCPTKGDLSHSDDPCQHPTVHSRKSDDSASLSRPPSCAFALAHQILATFPASTSLGNVEWKRQAMCCGNLNWFCVRIVCVFGDFSHILYLSSASNIWALAFMYPILKQICFALLDVGLRFYISFSIFQVHFFIANHSISFPFKNLWTVFNIQSDSMLSFQDFMQGLSSPVWQHPLRLMTLEAFLSNNPIILGVFIFWIFHMIGHSPLNQCSILYYRSVALHMDPNYLCTQV